MEIHINHIFEFISFLVSIYCYPTIKNSFMRWFMPFLGFVLVGELIANYQNHVLHESNYTINCLIAITESIFYGYIFYQLEHGRMLKRVILCFIPASVSYYVICFFLEPKNMDYLFTGIIIWGFFISGLALYYLYKEFSLDQNQILVRISGFWIAAGVSLFFSGISICFMLSGFIEENNLLLFGQKLYNIIPQMLSVVLYLCISIALVVFRQTYPDKKG